jgi:hypothetical protein
MIVLATVAAHGISAHAQVRSVLVWATVQGSDDCDFVHDLGKFGHVLADLDTWHVGADGLKGPANL